ncbi:hypothetical protein HID58_025494 [Brassica napus]|uniref:Uncharacterized protein n=1 Tax=Brassica napus TaxID=3708 RepID=A0ABQ8CL94_BRANA|nr:hypothetical protein HID58_025494 [Brassica napus]
MAIWDRLASKLVGRRIDPDWHDMLRIGSVAKYLLELIIAPACTLFDYDNGGVKVDHEVVYASSFWWGIKAESTSATNESVLKVPLDHGKQAAGVIKPHDREMVCQKVGDASMVKIIKVDD